MLIGDEEKINTSGYRTMICPIYVPNLAYILRTNHSKRSGEIRMIGEESFPGWAWLLMMVNVLLIFGLFLTVGCIDLIAPEQGGTADPGDVPEGLLVDPEVNLSTIDYMNDPYGLPYNGVHDRFSEAYTGSDLSVSLRDRLIEVMEEKAFDLGENGTVLGLCIKASYDEMDERPDRIPTYAEKCLWNEEDVWAIAFNRCNGWEDGIGHYDLFFISIQDIEDIYVTGCYGCNSTSPVVAEYHCR